MELTLHTLATPSKRSLALSDLPLQGTDSQYTFTSILASGIPNNQNKYKSVQGREASMRAARQGTAVATYRFGVILKFILRS